MDRKAIFDLKRIFGINQETEIDEDKLTDWFEEVIRHPFTVDELKFIIESESLCPSDLFDTSDLVDWAEQNYVEYE